MTYSVKEKTGQTVILEDGTVVVDKVVRLFENGVELAKVDVKRTIKPADDLTGDTSRAAKIATAARKLASDETTTQVTR